MFKFYHQNCMFSWLNHFCSWNRLRICRRDHAEHLFRLIPPFLNSYTGFNPCFLNKSKVSFIFSESMYIPKIFRSRWKYKSFRSKIPRKRFSCYFDNFFRGILLIKDFYSMFLLLLKILYPRLTLLIISKR